MSFNVQCAYDDDMNIIARSCECFSNQGGYASHGHALAANAINAFRWAYKDKVGCHTRPRPSIPISPPPALCAPTACPRASSPSSA